VCYGNTPKYLGLLISQSIEAGPKLHAGITGFSEMNACRLSAVLLASAFAAVWQQTDFDKCHRCIFCWN